MPCVAARGGPASLLHGAHPMAFGAHAWCGLCSLRGSPSAPCRYQRSGSGAGGGGYARGGGDGGDDGFFDAPSLSASASGGFPNYGGGGGGGR